MEIFTKYIDSPLKIIEISSTETHIISIMFKDAEKVASPQRKETKEIPQILDECIYQLNEYFEGKRKKFKLPLQQEGTDFQQTVWNKLLNIPFGQTISYLDLAKKLGDKNTIRAAASANGKNKLNIVIPCHRVIGSNGKMVGYGGDLWRKKWLLNHELNHSEKKWRLF
ncbi:MAG: cysteine methyltransferase [Bacteroidetes bacterium]|nr:MAG: cysteine methyltransferase [Bacteroidota bacterium]RLD79551.1 MAG: cysteine methyltransferase [Bacteroidota bacterium]